MGGGIGSILYRVSGLQSPVSGLEFFTYNAVGHTVALTLQTEAVSKSDLYEAYGDIVWIWLLERLLPCSVRVRIMPAMTPAIETSGLTRCFGPVRAVDKLNLRVEAGMFYGFLGPNGAGKSTTIKMLTGLLAPTRGSMRLLGADLADTQAAREVKRRIGVVPENLALYDNLTAREYLTFIGRMYLLSSEVTRSRSDELLAMMDLDQEENKLTHEYSHGMKKKLALAAALLPGPDLLFLDEPFEGVDAVSSRVLRDTLKQFVKRGATVFLTSHVLEIVERLCSHVGIIAEGRLVHEFAMSDLGQASTLEDRFLEVVGNGQDERPTLSWLEDDR
jgi:ABC-2 type transport system ATP-binding protein